MSQPLFEVPVPEKPTPITDAVKKHLAALADAGLLVGSATVAAEVAKNLAYRIDQGAKDYAVAALTAQLGEWLAQLPVPDAQEETGEDLATILRSLPTSA